MGRKYGVDGNCVLDWNLTTTATSADLHPPLFTLFAGIIGQASYDHRQRLVIIVRLAVQVFVAINHRHDLRWMSGVIFHRRRKFNNTKIVKK
jgi:hypothetical protein